jgi:hypothetical protein
MSHETPPAAFFQCKWEELQANLTSASTFVVSKEVGWWSVAVDTLNAHGINYGNINSGVQVWNRGAVSRAASRAWWRSRLSHSRLERFLSFATVELSVRSEAELSADALSAAVLGAFTSPAASAAASVPRVNASLLFRRAEQAGVAPKPVFEVRRAGSRYAVSHRLCGCSSPEPSALESLAAYAGSAAFRARLTELLPAGSSVERAAASRVEYPLNSLLDWPWEQDRLADILLPAGGSVVRLSDHEDSNKANFPECICAKPDSCVPSPSTDFQVSCCLAGHFSMNSQTKKSSATMRLERLRAQFLAAQRGHLGELWPRGDRHAEATPEEDEAWRAALAASVQHVDQATAELADVFPDDRDMPTAPPS